MSIETPVRPSDSLKTVRYEIRGRLARRAHELERLGYEIISLNIGNPRLFGFRTPETMRLAMIENLSDSEGYCHQKGMFPAREAVVMQQQDRGISGVSAEEVFIGNGVSELIDMVLRALLNDGDEVLVPSPDYPLWTAAVNLNRGRAVHYACRPENGFVPDPAEIEALITRRTRALVIINPNNPTGAAYPRSVLEELARIAERHQLVVFSDEIYDQMVYDGAESIPMATLVQDTLCATLSGLSKIYRACGYRVGWAVFSGRLSGAADYLAALELLSSLRLCSNVPAQWAVQTALGGYQSIREIVSPGGRLYESRRAIVDAVARQPLPAAAAAHRRHVRVRRSRYAGATGFRRSAVCARLAGAEARAGRARREFQRALPKPFPRYYAAGPGDAAGRVLAHRRVARGLCARSARGGSRACGRGTEKIQVTP